MCCCNNNPGLYSWPMNHGCHNPYNYTGYFTPHSNNCCCGGNGINSLALIALFALLCR